MDHRLQIEHGISIRIFESRESHQALWSSISVGMDGVQGVA